MTLEDFERELAESKSREDSHKRRHRSRSRDRDHRSKDSERRHHHRHHHSSKHHSSRDKDDDHESRHKHKRSRRDDDDHRSSRRHRDDDRDDEHRSSRRRHHERNRSRSPRADDEDAHLEKGAMDAPPTEDTLDNRLADAEASSLKRDSWMEAPSAMDVDYVQRRKEPEPDKTKATKKDYDLKIHDKELNQHLRDLQEGKEDTSLVEEPAQHEVSYTFGDNGSQWRMTKLKNVYREAKESGRLVDDIALERFGSLRDFDDAREEETELERRATYGKDYVGKEKPSGELYQERKMKAGVRRDSIPSRNEVPELPQGQIVQEKPPSAKAAVMDATSLNRLRAKMMKAKLKGGPEAEKLEAEYNAAMAGAANRKEPEVVVLGAMENRMLASRKGEVKDIDNKRGRERGLVEENEDMSIEDMVRQERRTRGQQGGEGYRLAETIAKDAKFDNDLDYMDENAGKLAKHVQKSNINLRNTAISDFQKMNRILDSCPLCHHEDTNTPPVAPVVSLATRVYLTLPTEPEISEGGACIIPIQHRINLLECDDDEWEEIRNFMKCLIRMYHDQGRDVIFYENAASPHRKHHAALNAVPIPYDLGETAPAFFREAILSADEEWTQHTKLIDTAKKSREGMGRTAFRRSIAKEMPYFHVWFELDGGMGHIVEDANRWPKGDLFARETLGGMLDVGPEVIKRQGRWHRNDRRVEGFRKMWKKFDWTRVLTEGQ
ncbi:Pre-mRNA-splicing factor cwf19 [Lasiodiplodia hormozganensis]|uniref:Pre-mRNA-splicing factor cwf19 n=1 Tax=Lasiodiplodia hormozganensis TaxID=869390 RepID=A0AA40CSP1_9PEZI|nr:Pre-mRNA-splicing factor cwf19 [Lasiodiplodia hormozganensis]